jgi:uncharacterized protein (DUF427 family)
MKAVLDGVVVAQSDDTVVVEGNHYFPPDSIDRASLRPAQRTTVCPWKGTASYYDVVVGDTVVANGAWYYPDPKEAAAEIRDHVAFYPAVTVEP